MDIAIVTYNRLPYLQKCVWSIIASQSTPHNIYIIDDCSNDGSREWLIDMRRRKLIKGIVLNKKPQGTAINFNIIIDFTEGETFVMANDDMYFHRDWDIEIEKIYQENKDCGIVTFYNYARFNFDKCVEWLNPSLIRTSRTGMGCTLVNRELYKKAGKFNLKKTKMMGYFATPFCVSASKVPIKRNKHYAPIPSFAIHMDERTCKLNEIEYITKNGYYEHRSKHKNNKVNTN